MPHLLGVMLMVQRQGRMWFWNCVDIAWCRAIVAAYMSALVQQAAGWLPLNGVGPGLQLAAVKQKACRTRWQQVQGPTWVHWCGRVAASANTAPWQMPSSIPVSTTADSTTVVAELGAWLWPETRATSTCAGSTLPNLHTSDQPTARANQTMYGSRYGHLLQSAGQSNNVVGMDSC